MPCVVQKTLGDLQVSHAGPGQTRLDPAKCGIFRMCRVASRTQLRAYCVVRAAKRRGSGMAPIEDFRSIDEIRRKVIADLLDLVMPTACRRLTPRQDVTRRLRCRLRH